MAISQGSSSQNCFFHILFICVREKLVVLKALANSLLTGCVTCTYHACSAWTFLYSTFTFRHRPTHTTIGKTDSRQAFRNLFPDSPSTGDALETQQRALLMQQEEELHKLKAEGKSRFSWMLWIDQLTVHQKFPWRCDTLLDSFLAVIMILCDWLSLKQP